MNLSLSYILVESTLLYKNDHLHTAILAPFYQKMTNQFYCQGGQWPLIQFSGMKCNQQTDRYTEEVEISNLPLAFGHIKVKKSSLVGPPTGNSGFFFSAQNITMASKHHKLVKAKLDHLGFIFQPLDRHTDSKTIDKLPAISSFSALTRQSYIPLQTYTFPCYLNCSICLLSTVLHLCIKKVNKQNIVLHLWTIIFMYNIQFNLNVSICHQFLQSQIKIT